MGTELNEITSGTATAQPTPEADQPQTLTRKSGVQKKKAKMANCEPSWLTVATRKRRWWKRCRCRSGSGATEQRHTNSAPARSATATSTRVRESVRPHAPDCRTANVNRPDAA